MIPQLCITTHSSHIVDTADFEKIRYFKRCPLKNDDPDTVETFNASLVHSLSKFNDIEESNDAESLRFLKRYMKLTHCDIFFADAVILVEGGVEKLLLPEMTLTIWTSMVGHPR